jgi:hypothetical protein
MKKSILSIFALSAAFLANGQSIQSSPGYAVDNFSSATEVTSTTEPGLGIYFFKDTTNIAFPYDSGSVSKTGLLSQSKVRLGNGYLGYSLTQPYNVALPIGFDFGKGKSIDASAAYKSVKFVLAANSDTSLYFMFTLVDAAGNTVNSVGPNAASKPNWYKDEIGFVIDKGNAPRYNYNAAAGVKNAVKFAKTGDSITVTIDFTGAYNAMYGPDTANYDFDPSMLTEVVIAVVNDHQNSADGYKRYPLSNAQVGFSLVQVGDITLGVNDEQLFNTKGFVAYPNPSKGGIVHFNVNAENVKVMDFQGKVVFSAANASEVNTESFAKGIYLVQTSKGSTRFVVE